MKWITRSLI